MFDNATLADLRFLVITTAVLVAPTMIALGAGVRPFALSAGF